jgi:hypothetical protein
MSSAVVTPTEPQVNGAPRRDVGPPGGGRRSRSVAILAGVLVLLVLLCVPIATLISDARLQDGHSRPLCRLPLRARETGPGGCRHSRRRVGDVVWGGPTADAEAHGGPCPFLG